MELPDLIRRTEQLADLEKAKPVGPATLYRCEAHFPVPCFLELNCKNNSYLVFFGLYYDVFRFRFYEKKVLFKGELVPTKQYIEAQLLNDIKPMRELAPAAFLARADPMPFGDMGLCDKNLIDSVRTFDGSATMTIIGAIDAIGTSDKPVPFEILKRLLRHSSASIRMHALTALLTLRSAPETEKLLALLETRDDSDPMISDLAQYCAKVMYKIEPYKA